MVEMLRLAKGVTDHKATNKAKSYLLQEAEAVSRWAKVAEAKKLGVTVQSLQHDGVVASPHAYLSQQAVASALARAASTAAGYEVEVTPKAC